MKPLNKQTKNNNTYVVKISSKFYIGQWNICETMYFIIKLRNIKLLYIIIKKLFFHVDDTYFTYDIQYTS